MPVILELKNVAFQRGDFCLSVHHLRLETGKLYSLQGENGAGKSSLLQLLALLQPPQSGHLQFAGQPVTYKAAALKRLRHQVTLLEQNPFLFSGNVEQNLVFGLKLRGINGAERQKRIEEALAITGLQDFNQRPTDKLSGGETRRVALARALCLQPKLLLLDEPTANLDVGQVASLERFLVSLPKRGMTLVVASHDAHQPQRLGGDVISLANGRIERIKPAVLTGDYTPQLRSVAS